MNTLGHAYVAVHAVSGNKQLLITGALVSESSPFIPDSPFTWKEIHESGEKLLAFLDQNHPQKRDLALGILTHSLKYGADGFNKEIEKYAGEERGRLVEQIKDCSNLDSKTAETQLHNFLGGGLDCWLLRTEPKLVKEVQKVIVGPDIKGISRLLAEFFDKDLGGAEEVFRQLFQGIYRTEDLATVGGLTRTWARQAEGLPEGNGVDVPKAVEIIKACTDLLKDDWREFLGKIVRRVRKSLLPFATA